MCNDLEAGKAIEADFISGVLHRLGQELAVSTPVHSVAYRALKYYTLPKS
jgi:ketopantoate reductase